MASDGSLRLSSMERTNECKMDELCGGNKHDQSDGNYGILCPNTS